jgi:6-phosphogluconolactonase
MPVDTADLNAAGQDYAATLTRVAGMPPVLDLVQLGLGTDGHTASLVPDDAALAVVDRDVTTTGLYQATRRMTLTLPVLNRARERLWLVTGATKAPALADLMDGSGSAPASRIRREETRVLADRAATAIRAR